jgi:hypothetical protein
MAIQPRYALSSNPSEIHRISARKTFFNIKQYRRLRIRYSAITYIALLPNAPAHKKLSIIRKVQKTQAAVLLTVPFASGLKRFKECFLSCFKSVRSLMI